jgi:lariat debranching enzyme
VPYTPSTLRSVYHIRRYDVEKLSHLPSDVPTVFLSHDWPIGIAHHGNTHQLLQRKKFFRAEVS